MCPYRQGNFACASHAFCVKKKKLQSCSGQYTESLRLSLCLAKLMLCARKDPILPLDRTGMVFLKDGIYMATELT